MDDPVQVTVSGDTPEAIAFALYQQLLTGQQILRAAKGRGHWAPPKDWILQTYSECLAVVKSGAYRSNGGGPTETAPAETAAAETAASAGGKTAKPRGAKR